jgi:hypothetical protein
LRRTHAIALWRTRAIALWRTQSSAWRICRVGSC